MDRANQLYERPLRARSSIQSCYYQMGLRETYYITERSLDDSIRIWHVLKMITKIKKDKEKQIENDRKK